MRKRFVISTSPIGGQKLDNLFFRYSEDCAVKKYKDCIVFGNMYSSTGLSFEQYLEKVELGEIGIQDALFYMCGRYLVIYKNAIYADAVGLMTCFYYVKDKITYISNDLLYFKETFGLQETRLDIQWGDFFGYMPAPYTVLPGVNKLLNSEYLFFKNNTLSIGKKTAFTKLSLKPAEIVERLEKAYTNVLTEIVDSGKRVALTLTGGVDSRTTYSLMLKSGIEFSTFSHAHPIIKSHDIEIPKAISERYGKKYSFIPAGEYDPVKEKEYDDFLLGSIADADKYVYANGVDYPNEKGLVVVKSGIYEGTIDYFEHFLNLKDFSKKTFLEKLTGKIMPKIADTVQYDSLSAWYDRLDVEHLNDGFYTQLYLQQRNGAWSSYTERGYDLYDTEFIHLVDCSYILSLWMAFPPKWRNLEKKHQRYVIRTLYPELDKEYRYNGMTLASRWKDRTKNMIKRLIHY